LLLAVKRRAARVRWADQVAEHAMKAHRESCAELGEGDPDIPPSEVRTWLAESRNEERLMTRAAKMAVDAGVADAMIRRVEHEGKMISEIWLAGIDAIDLTQDQRVKALSAMHAMLARLGPKMPSPIDGNVIDMPPLDGD
jgi:hypothetical protein